MVRLPVIHNKRFQNDEKVLMFFNKTMIRRVKEREINEIIQIKFLKISRKEIDETKKSKKQLIIVE